MLLQADQNRVQRPQPQIIAQFNRIFQLSHFIFLHGNQPNLSPGINSKSSSLVLGHGHGYFFMSMGKTCHSNLKFNMVSDLK